MRSAPVLIFGACGLIACEQVYEYASRSNISVGNWSGVLAKGVVEWSGITRSTDVFILPALLSKDEVQHIQQHIRKVELTMVVDSVDMMPAFESWIALGRKNFSLPVVDAQSEAVRNSLEQFTAPIIAERILPFVNEQYDAFCRGQCLVCSSFVRRYLPGERRGHPLHQDIKALVTIVVSLAEFGVDYEGGIFLEAGAWRRFVPLKKGDAIIHQSDLFHGVEVLSGARWSWIMWVERVECNSEDPSSWHLEGARRGDPVLQALVVTMILGSKARDSSGHYVEPLSKEDNMTCLELLQLSVLQGFPPAKMMLGDAYINEMFGLEKNLTEGTMLIEQAANASYSKALFELGRLHYRAKDFAKAWEPLRKAAELGHPSAMVFLGDISRANGELTDAIRWFEAAGTPNAYWARGEIEEQLGSAFDSPAVLSWVGKAARLGDQEACDRYQQTASGRLKDRVKVIVDCISAQGGNSAFNSLLDFYRTLTKRKEKLYCVKAMRRMAASADQPHVLSGLTDMAKRDGLEL